MSAPDTHGNVNSGEAGQRGQDRQPVKRADSHVQAPAPEGGDVAAAGQVRTRSDQASAGMKGGHSRKDQLDPGPDREEAEKSKGDAHHDQRETEKDMSQKVEKL
jgi:hypothetical protein